MTDLCWHDMNLRYYTETQKLLGSTVYDRVLTFLQERTESYAAKRYWIDAYAQYMTHGSMMVLSDFMDDFRVSRVHRMETQRIKPLADSSYPTELVQQHLLDTMAQRSFRAIRLQITEPTSIDLADESLRAIRVPRITNELDCYRQYARR